MFALRVFAFCVAVLQPWFAGAQIGSSSPASGASLASSASSPVPSTSPSASGSPGQPLVVDASADLEKLPTGLAVTQLRGNLVAPPLRMFPKGVVAASDDRKVNFVDQNGNIVWTRELQRQIRAPLYAIGNVMVLVSTGGDMLTCFRIDGTKLWEKRLPGLSDSWLLANTEGRLIQIFKDGTIRVMNPDASALFDLSLGQTPSGPPALDLSGVRIPVSPGKYRYLGAEGTVSDERVSDAVPVVESLRFVPLQKAGSYEIRFTSPASDLRFTSTAVLGHWVVDNRSPRSAAWGDSKWRLFQFTEQAGTGSGTTPTSSMIPETPYRALFAGATPQQLLELRYVRNLLDSLRSDGQLEDYLQSAVRAERLPGRLLFLEDLCVDMLGSRVLQQRFPVLRARIWSVLSAFPSYARGPELAALLSGERDMSVVTAACAYLEKRGNDSGASFRAAIARALPLWRSSNGYSGLRETLVSAIRAIAPSWPAGDSANTIIAEILLP